VDHFSSTGERVLMCWSLFRRRKAVELPPIYFLSGRIAAIEFDDEGGLLVCHFRLAEYPALLFQHVLEPFAPLRRVGERVSLAYRPSPSPCQRVLILRSAASDRRSSLRAPRF